MEYEMAIQREIQVLLDKIAVVERLCWKAAVNHDVDLVEQLIAEEEGYLDAIAVLENRLLKEELYGD